MNSTSEHFFLSPRVLRNGHIRTLYCLIVAGAVVLRIVLTGQFVDLRDPLLWEYGKIAANLADTGVFALYEANVPSAFMPPAYPVIIAGIYKLFGTELEAYVTLAALLLSFNIIVPILIGWVAQRIWGARVGFVAFLFALVWPALLAMSGRLHPIPIYTALQIGAVGVAFSSGWNPFVRAILLGIVMGLYANFRFEAPLILAVLCWVALRTDADCTPRKSRPWVRKTLLTGVSVTMFALVTTPWVVRNWIVFDKPLLSTSGGYNLLRGHHQQATGTGRDHWVEGREDASTKLPHVTGMESLDYTQAGDELVADNLYRDAAFDYIRTHPRHEVELFFEKVFYFLVTDFTHPFFRRWPLWIPSLLGLVIGFAHWLGKGKRDRPQQALWALFFLQLAVVVVFFVLPRYRIAVDFVPILFTAAWFHNSRIGGGLSRFIFPEKGA